MFSWERFRVLAPRPNEFDLVDLVIIEVQGMRISTPAYNKYGTKGLRWSGFKPLTKRTLKKELEVEMNHTFRPYSHTADEFFQYSSTRMSIEMYH